MLYPSAPGTAVFTNKYAKIDYSNANEGYITVTFEKTEKHCRIKLFRDDESIMYDMDNNPTVIPLNLGEGKYIIKTYLQALEPIKYITTTPLEIDVKFREKDIMFKYPNQRVNYRSKSQVVIKAAQLCIGAKSQAEKLSRIYNFVFNNFIYDEELAFTVQTGYLPNPDKTLSLKKGICCDIASMFAAMCRSQGLLVKYVTGYVKKASAKYPIYHAYNIIKIDNDIDLNGLFIKKNTFTRIDLTFDITSKNDKKLKQSFINFISNPNNYQDRHFY